MAATLISSQRVCCKRLNGEVDTDARPRRKQEMRTKSRQNCFLIRSHYSHGKAWTMLMLENDGGSKVTLEKTAEAGNFLQLIKKRKLEK